MAMVWPEPSTLTVLKLIWSMPYAFFTSAGVMPSTVELVAAGERVSEEWAMIESRLADAAESNRRDSSGSTAVRKREFITSTVPFAGGFLPGFRPQDGKLLF